MNNHELLNLLLVIATSLWFFVPPVESLYVGWALLIYLLLAYSNYANPSNTRAEV